MSDYSSNYSINSSTIGGTGFSYAQFDSGRKYNSSLYNASLPYDADINNKFKMNLYLQ